MRPCKWCRVSFTKDYYDECTSCWELSTRIDHHPSIAIRMLLEKKLLVIQNPSGKPHFTLTIDKRGEEDEM